MIFTMTPADYVGRHSSSIVKNESQALPLTSR